MKRRQYLTCAPVLLVSLLLTTAAFGEKTKHQPLLALSLATLPLERCPSASNYQTPGTKEQESKNVMPPMQGLHEGAAVQQQCREGTPPPAVAPSESKIISVVIKGNQTEISVINGEERAGEVSSGEILYPADNTTALSAIERNVSLFTVRLKERFHVWLERSARYIEIMREVLKDKKLPEELVFLPFVESGFNVHAYSRARAVGPWQFIEATAKRYGLVVDWWRDERKDPVKSTQAAAAYLTDLYSMFGSWHLALAAYNAGEGRIMKALKRTDADDYWSLLQTNQLHNETKEYVPRFFAAKKIANAPEQYGFSDLVYHEPIEFDEVTIRRPLDIEVIAQCAETSVQEIRDLNPELRRWSTPPNVDRYTVRIPKGTVVVFHENLDQLSEKECFSYDTYVVSKGETIKKVARKLNVPVSALLALNDLGGIERLKAGQKIKVPPQGKFFLDLDDRISASARAVSFVKQPSVRQKTSCKVGERASKRSAQKKTRDKIKAKKV